MKLNLLRLPAVLARRAMSRSVHYREIKDGSFPPPVRLGSRCAAWPEHEVDALIRAQIAGSTSDELRTLTARLVAEREVHHG